MYLRGTVSVFVICLKFAIAQWIKLQVFRKNVKTLNYLATNKLRKNLRYSLIVKVTFKNNSLKQKCNTVF